MKKKTSLKWLYLDFNSYFATIEQQIRPGIRNRPIVIVPTMTDATCAIAASYEAKACGIKTGTMIYIAKKLCPDLICIQANHKNYVKYHHKLMFEINKYIPIETIASIDEVACKLTGTDKISVNAIKIAKSIKQGISQNIGDYIKCSIGISTNKFLAKTASNLEKPDGLQILYSEDIPNKIKDLKLSNLTGIGKKMEKRLFLSGVESIEDLYRLSPKNMRKIWGSVLGEKFWYLIRGKEIVEIPTKNKTIGHSHVLHPNWRTPAKSKKVLYRLITKAATRLRRSNSYCSKLEIGIKLENNYKIKNKINFYQVCDNFTLLDETDTLWKNLFQNNNYKRIKKISVVLYGLKKTSDIQPSLFNNRFIKKREQLSEAMDVINSRFGRDSIVIGNLPNEINQFSGTKIAFTRIPDEKEFFE